MTRIKTLGLCLVAVFALSAMAASAASAGEVGECVKAAKVGKTYTGKYTDKNCQILATELQKTEGKKNKYEWSPGVTPANSKFEAKSKTAKLEGPAGTITCKASVTKGEWTSNKTDSEVATFTSCEFNGAVKGECHSAGQAAGTIVTNKLTTNLLDAGEHGLSGGTVGAGEVWDQFVSAEPSGIQAEYLCAGIVEIRTKGSLSGVFTPASLNKVSPKATIEFNGSIGEEDLFNEASVAGGPFEPAGPGIENLVAASKGAKIEIRAV
jgi:hypothetical protein